MKRIVLIFLLCLCLLLCACQSRQIAVTEPSAPAQTAQASAAQQASSRPVQTLSAQPSPSSTPVQSQQAAPSVQSECPLDLRRAAPLFEAAAESLVLDGDWSFKRFPDALVADRLFARLLRDGGVNGASAQENGIAIGLQDLKALYADCFSEGEFDGLPQKDAFGAVGGEKALFALPDSQELQFSVRMENWKALEENGYYELELSLYWAYPEDAQAICGGSFLCWVKKTDASAYGLALAMLEPSIHLRPGDDFGAHPARDVQQIMPMLHAVAEACLATGDGFADTPSDRFAFEAAYALLNSYGKDFGLSVGSSPVTVTAETMQSAMHALFGPQQKTPASVPSALRGRLKASGSGYRLQPTQEETKPLFVDYVIAESAVERITVSLFSGDRTEESPEKFHGSAVIAVDIAEGLPYRNRYARDARFTPQK